MSLAKLFSRYVIFAGIATVVDMSVLFVMTSVFSVHYLISAVFGYLAGMVTNYTLNKKHTFQNTSTRIPFQFGVFSLIASVGLILNQVTMFVFVEFVGAGYLIAKVIAVGFVAVWSFWGHKKFTFSIF
jgi:putative flippase GtrA